MLVAGLGACLLSDGWTLRTAPGEPLLVVRDSEVIDPHAVVTGLSGQTLDREEWKRRCTALGLAGRSLSPS